MPESGPLPFGRLVDAALAEIAAGRVAQGSKVHDLSVDFHGKTASTPFAPIGAAFAQDLVAAYLRGARILELDGASDEPERDGRRNADRAWIGLPEVKLGVLPGTGGTQRLGRLLGKSKAMEMIVEARTLSVAEAKDAGIVNKVFEKEGFLEKVLEYARSFCPPGKASKAVGNVKRALQSGLEMSFAEGLSLERELQAELFASEDAREGLAAFVEKRNPAFKGR